MKKNLLLLLTAAALVLAVFVLEIERPPRSAIGTLGQMGYLVERVFEGSPAEKAGLLPGDVIFSINGSHIDSRARFRRLVGAARPGRTLTVQLFRYNPERVGFEARRIAVTPIPATEISPR